MTDLKIMKENTPIDNIHHWVLGAIISLTGIIFGLVKRLMNLSPFLTSLGFGIMLTDFPHMAKQLDNYYNGQSLDQGIVSNDEGWVKNDDGSEVSNSIIDVN